MKSMKRRRRRGSKSKRQQYVGAALVFAEKSFLHQPEREKTTFSRFAAIICGDWH